MCEPFICKTCGTVESSEKSAREHEHEMEPLICYGSHCGKPLTDIVERIANAREFYFFQEGQVRKHHFKVGEDTESTLVCGRCGEPLAEAQVELFYEILHG